MGAVRVHMHATATLSQQAGEDGHGPARMEASLSVRCTLGSENLGVEPYSQSQDALDGSSCAVQRWCPLVLARTLAHTCGHALLLVGT